MTAEPSITEFLREVPLLADLGEAALERIAALASWRHLPAGEQLITEGARGRDLFVVHTGRVEIARTIDGARRVLGTAGRGATLGELSLLTHEPRSATVRALRDTRVVVLAAADFETVLLSEPTATLALARILANRLVTGRPEPPLPATPSAVAVVALTDDVPGSGLIDVLRDDLATCGAVATLRREDAGDDPVDRHQRFAALERDHRFVLLDASHPARDPIWPAFCTRVADRVLLLTRGGTPPAWAVEDPGCHHRDVVFATAHPSPARMGPTLTALDARSHHHLPPGTGFADAARRIARRVSGRAVGIVFSGGGARGHAHVGVIAALEEAGIELDRAGGTSAGAIAASLVATGRTTSEFEPVVRRELAAQNPFGDITIPRQAFSRGRRIRAVVEHLFGDAMIEAAPRPLFIVSADLDTGEPVVHRRGRIADAVVASLSIPGLAPPARLADRNLVDGGLLNNFPVDVMASQAEGPIIGVDVMRQLRQDRTGEVPARDRRAGLVATLARTMMLGSQGRSARNRDLADLLITPDVHDIGLLDFDRFDDAVRAGRAATVEALAGGGHQLR